MEEKVILTEKRVRDAKPHDRTRIECDKTVKGLGLRITAAGMKSFVLDYYADGKRRRMTLGRVGEISLEKARRRAHEIRLSAREGADPLQTARDRRELPTVSEALDRFLAEYVPRRTSLGRMASSTAKEYRRQIERDVRPVLGRKRVSEVSRHDVELALVKLPPISANRVLALLSKVFRCCEDWEWRPQNTNPARGVEKAREEARDRTLSEDELAALGRALSSIRANEGAILAIHLAALTGLRIGEVQAIRWSDIDMRSGSLTLPKTKTGRRVHTLPRAALALLAEAKQVGECVVPGREPNKPLDVRLIRRVFAKACQEGGIEGARLHDLRRTVMTQAAAMGVGAHLLRDMVGHKTTAMADRYIRQAGEPLTELRERIGAGMASQMSMAASKTVEDRPRNSATSGHGVGASTSSRPAHRPRLRRAHEPAPPDAQGFSVTGKPVERDVGEKRLFLLKRHLAARERPLSTRDAIQELITKARESTPTESDTAWDEILREVYRGSVETIEKSITQARSRERGSSE